MSISLNINLDANELLSSIGSGWKRHRQNKCFHPSDAVVRKGENSRCLECGIVETSAAMSKLRQRNCPHLSGWQLVEDEFHRVCLDCGKSEYEPEEYRRRLGAETGTLIIPSDMPLWYVRAWKWITFRSPRR